MLASRLLDTAIGIGVGLLVNLLVWPPLRDRAAAHRIDLIDDRMGELLCDMAGDPDSDWIERTSELDDEVDEAWRRLGQARESGRFNPRRGVPARMRAADSFAEILRRLEQAVAEARSMAFTISGADVEPALRELLHRAGTAIGDADVDAIAAVRADLDGAAREGLSAVEGAVLVNLRNILEALGAVAGAQPVRVPA